METTQDTHAHGEANGQTHGQTEGLADQLSDRALVLQERVAQLNDRALEVIRERPGACLLGAVAIGFIVGKIASRY